MKHLEKFGMIVIVDENLTGDEWYLVNANDLIITSELYKAGATHEDIEKFWQWWREYSQKTGFPFYDAWTVASMLMRFGCFVPPVDPANFSFPIAESDL